VSMSTGRCSELSAEHEVRYTGNGRSFVTAMSKTSGGTEGFPLNLAKFGKINSAYMDIFSVFSPAWDEYIHCRTMIGLQKLYKHRKRIIVLLIRILSAKTVFTYFSSRHNIHVQLSMHSY
jgi:hypothetical protein